MTTESIAQILGYLAVGGSALIVLVLIAADILRSRKEGIPTPSSWFITRNDNGSLIGGEFIEIEEA